MDEFPFSRAEAKDLGDAEFHFDKFAADSCFGALKACPECGVAGGFFLENFKIGRALRREDFCVGIVSGYDLICSGDISSVGREEGCAPGSSCDSVQ